MIKTEAQKASRLKWDRENMRTLACRVRTDEAEIFKEYCTAHNTTSGNLIKKFVMSCIAEYGEELSKAEQGKE